MLRHKLRYKRNPHQKEFHDDIESRFLHLSTGFGGGKTYALCMKAMQLSRLNAPYRGGLVVPDFQEFKKDVLPEMLDILSANNIQFRYHKTDHWFKFPWSPGLLHIASADKPIRGPNWAYAVVNELTLIPLAKYKEVIGRVRIKGAKFPQVASCGTPEGYASEYYDYMIEEPRKGMRIIYGSTDDNAHNLHENYLDNLESAYDSKWIEAYRRGLWVNMATGRFYYSFNPLKQFDKTIRRDEFVTFLCSMDFNVDPFCATLWGFDGWGLYGCDQIELKGDQGYSTANMIQALKARNYTPQNTVIYPDPAGKARSTKGAPDNTVLEQAGYVVHVKPQAPSFRARQLNVNNLLDKSRIKFNPDICKGIKKDFEAVEQDPITLEKKKNNPNLTHFSDGLDYMCDILFPFSGNAKATTITKVR